MRKIIVGLFLLIFTVAATAFAAESSNESKELVTPRGNVSVGMSEEKLYNIFQEQDRILIPHSILGNEWHVFRDFRSKNPNDTITFYINDGKVTGWKMGYAPSPGNKGSRYEYNNNEHIDVWFFPGEKAKWDGSKVNLLDWNKLTKAQKVLFITEYIRQFNKLNDTGISVDIDRYILAMDYLNDNCPEACKSIPAGDAIDNLLISDGKAKEETR